MRKLLLLLPVFLPQPVKKVIYRKLMKWQIGSDVMIGFSYIDSGNVVIEDNVKIGHLNVIRGIKHLCIGEGTYIANLNQFFGASYPDWASELNIGMHVNFMSRHFIDVGGTVSIGDGTVVGGRDTQFWSHTRVFVAGEPTLKPTSVDIGANVYVGARATLVSCVIPNGEWSARGAWSPKDSNLNPAGY